MNNIENIILEFVRYIDPEIYLIIIPALLCFPLIGVLTIINGYKNTNKKEKRTNRCFLVFLILVFVGGNTIIFKSYFNVKNKTIADLNNENNIVLQEKNNNIEVYYISKTDDKKIDENILEKGNLKITIQQTEDEKYYIYFANKKEQKKEVKKEDLKDFIQNIKKQENYKEIEKNKKLSLENFK